MIIDNKFEIGAIVYLKTDKEQEQRVVSGLIVGKYDVVYELSCGVNTSRHYDFEISTKKDTVIACI